ncbi:MAG: HAD family hydrolase [Clostridiales bacterium]|jgi:pyrophosphatase PpaX|nr:HAD family hydrolase [Clostridiales bacterium]
MTKKAIIFDFDGTIMDTNDLILNSWQHTFKHFEGKERSIEEIYETFGETLTYSMQNLLPNVETGLAIEKYREYQVVHSDEQIKIFDDIVKLLDELKNRDLLLSIVTSRLRNTTMKYLKSFDLLDYFDVIVTCDDTNIHKPKPEPALIALKKLNVRKDETIMVGDTRFDIGCANSAGIDSVLVNWGVAYRQENLPSEFIPKYVINKPMELLEVI